MGVLSFNVKKEKEKKEGNILSAVPSKNPVPCGNPETCLCSIIFSSSPYPHVLSPFPSSLYYSIPFLRRRIFHAGINYAISFPISINIFLPGCFRVNSHPSILCYLIIFGPIILQWTHSFPTTKSLRVNL